MYQVNVGRKILGANEEYAAQNAKLLAGSGKLCLNIISSPGAGKTTLLARTISELKSRLRIGVIEGDIATDIDAKKIAATGAPVIQINTDGACHLSALQVNSALAKLPLKELDVVFIENVGNLVCPAAFELGEDGKVVVLSVAEGDDKPAKYPAIFARSKVLLINKIDLLANPAMVDFDIEKVRTEARRLNKNIAIFEVSAKTGDGTSAWFDWLTAAVKRFKGANK